MLYIPDKLDFNPKHTLEFPVFINSFNMLPLCSRVAPIFMLKSKPFFKTQVECSPF